MFYFLVIIIKNKKFALRQYDDNIFAIDLTEDELADVYETVSDLIPGSFDYHNKPTLITNKLELLVDILCCKNLYFLGFIIPLRHSTRRS